MTSSLQRITELDSRVDNILTSGGTMDTTDLETQIDTNTTEISTLQTTKQDKLIEGDNITIVNNVISSSGGTLQSDANFTSVDIKSELIESSNTTDIISFDTRLLKRTDTDNMNLREVQLLINNANVLPSQTNHSNDIIGEPLGDAIEFITNSNLTGHAFNGSTLASNSVNCTFNF